MRTGLTVSEPEIQRKLKATMFLGLRTVIYHVPDLTAAKAWYAAAFGVTPYFDEPFDVRDTPSESTERL